MRIAAFTFLAGLGLVAVLLLLLVIVNWPPAQGLDLKGGVRLVYEVDREQLFDGDSHPASPSVVPWPALLESLSRRLNPSGTQELVVRRHGEWQVEILTPETDPTALGRMEKLIGTAGCLAFRIVANSRDHAPLIELAHQQAEDVSRRKDRQVREGGRVVGLWVRVGREPRCGPDGIRPLTVGVGTDTIRNADTGEILSPPASTLWSADERALERWLSELEVENVEVLMAVDDGFDVTGAHLSFVSRAFDEAGQPCIAFSMKGEGAALMAGLTGANLPHSQPLFYRRLGIVLDDTLLTAPRLMSTISDRGRITGRFTPEDVDFFVGVLQAGALPCPLRAQVISKSAIPADAGAVRSLLLILGGTVGALALVWLLAVWRYGWMGVSAGLTSLIQGLTLLAAIELLRVAVTMPLVLGAAVVVLLAAAANLWPCECLHRVLQRPEPTAGAVGWGLFRGILPLAVVFCGLIVTANVAHFWGRYSASLAIVLGGLAAFIPSCVCLPVVLGLFAGNRRRAVEEAEPVVAKLVDWSPKSA